MNDIDTLLYWVSEREKIRKAQAARKPMPWSTDPIFKYRFCNVRREDDRVTKWIAEHIRKPFADHPYLWLMLCIARMINWPPTLDFLIKGECWPHVEGWLPEFGRKLNGLALLDGVKVYTGAYVIPGPADGGPKGTYLANEVIGRLWEDRRYIGHLFEIRSTTMQEVHTEIGRHPGWGPFLAYQAVVDMRFCPALLQKAPDRHSWAAAGPGTIRGLNRLAGRPLNKQIPQRQALEEMMRLFGDDRLEQALQATVELSDVPNILCEYDKYRRVLNGEGTPRSLYHPYNSDRGLFT